MPRKSLTHLCHQQVQQRLTCGDYAVDATIGNGHDTLFLARQVGDDGVVFGFDIQAAALSSTETRLKAHDCHTDVRLNLASHSQISELIPPDYHQRIQVVMFNLGYLPGSDKSVITQSASTLSALQQACKLISEDGLITVMVYPGHSGGDRESEAVFAWCERLEKSLFRITVEHSASATGPSLIVIEKHPQPPA